MIRALSFDWGGVFTEGTFDAAAVRALARATGRPEEDLRDPYLALMARFEEGAFDLPTFHRRFSEATGTALEADAFRATFLGAIPERRSTIAFLATLPDRYRVGMLSNNVPVLCDLVRDDRRFGRIERFLFSNEIGVRKPDPAAFAALERALDVPPHETVFVDDAERNVAAARELGFQAILLDTVPRFAERWRVVVPDVPPPDPELDA